MVAQPVFAYFVYHRQDSGKQIPYCAACGRVIGSKTRFCIYDGTPVPDDVLSVALFCAGKPGYICEYED